MPKVVAAGASGHGGAGRRRRPKVTTALSEINVVPLVDVMLVLLIIFMVAAPMMQQGLDVNLPQQRRAPAMPAPQRSDLRHGAGELRAEPARPAGQRIDSSRSAGRAHPPARRAPRGQAGLPAQRRPGDDAADDGRHGSPEGRRRREGRHRLAGRRAADSDAGVHMAMTSDLVSSTIAARAARAGGPAQDDDRVGARARGRDRRARRRAVAGRRAVAAARSADGDQPGRRAGPGLRRHDALAGRAVQKAEPKPELPKPEPVASAGGQAARDGRADHQADAANRQ